jgi:hypothetical protein
MKKDVFFGIAVGLIVLLILGCSTDKEDGDGFPCSFCEEGWMYYSSSSRSSTVPKRNSNEANPISLTAGIWANSSITSTASGSEVWYSFKVTSGTTYYVWWNDLDGNETYNFDIEVSAYYASGTIIFTDIDAGWSSPQKFTANATGTVRLRVRPLSSGNTRAFAIVYNTSSTRPSGQ